MILAENSRFRINGDIHYAPVAYGDSYEINSHNLATSWLVGIQKQSHTCGIELLCDFFLLDSGETDADIKDNRINISALLDNFYRFGTFSELKWGLGGFWLRDTFNHSSGRQVMDYTGFSFLHSLKLQVPDFFVWLEFTNKINLVLGVNSSIEYDNFALDYSGGLRININPGVTWLNLYLEAKALYWNYFNQWTEIDKWMIKLGTGMSLDTSFLIPKTDPREDSVPHVSDSLLEPQIKEQIVPGTLEGVQPGEIDPGLPALLECKTGDIIGFYNIFFEKQSDILQARSFVLLNAITRIFINKNELVISMAVYSIYTDDPELDINLYWSRTRAVKQFFIDRGIAKERLLTNPEGYLLISDDSPEPKMIFEVISTSSVEN